MGTVADDIKALQEQMALLLTALDDARADAAASKTDAAETRSELDQLIAHQRTADVTGLPSTTSRVYVAQSRRLDRFRGRPTSNNDPTVSEWIGDVKGQFSGRHLTTPESQAAFVIEHLAGKARQEIQGRGGDLLKSPDSIFTVLNQIFGDDNNLEQLQSAFYSFKQTKEDLVECSLELVDLYDKMVVLDDSYKASRTKTLKGRLAESVKDPSLAKELRRLNVEFPDFSFFEMRDRAIKWMGQTKPSHRAASEEVGSSSINPILDALKELQETIKLQNKPKKQQKWKAPPGSNNKCFRCGSTDHFIRNCPEKASKPTTAGVSEKKTSSN